MTLSEKQRKFTQYVALLIIYAYSQGFELTLGEVYRPLEMQKLYYKRGLTKTLKSKHLQRLAIDINLFDKGKYENGKTKESFDKYKVLGDFWKSLDPNNRWGGDWEFDPGHFEYAR